MYIFPIVFLIFGLCRKHDVSLADFKNFVLNSIEAVSYCYNDVILDSVQSFSASAVLSRVSVSEMFKNSFRMIRNYTDGVREILQALTKCSSPEQPCKLLSKLIEPVSGIVSELGATAVEMGNDVSNTSRLFLAVRDVAGIAVIMRELLICCMSGFGWDDASSEAVNVGKSIIELSGRALFAAIKHLQSSARYPGQPGLDDYVTSAAMATPLTPCFLYFHHDARCMDLMAVTVPSVLDISTNGNSPESLAIFNAFLCECEAQWQQLSIDLRLSLLKITKEFYMRNEFEASIITCRNQIELFAIAIKGLESNVDILENIDEIVKFIAS